MVKHSDAIGVLSLDTVCWVQYIDDLVQDCSNSSELAIELP